MMFEGMTHNQQPVATDERSAAATCMLSLVDPARAAAMVRRSARPLAVGAVPEAATAARELKELLGAAEHSAADYFVQQRERASLAALQSVAVRVPSLWLGLLSHSQPLAVRRCCERAGTLGISLILAHVRDEAQRSRILLCAGEMASIAAIAGGKGASVRERGAATLAAALWLCLAGLPQADDAGSSSVQTLGACMFAAAWRRIDPGDARLLAAAARWDVLRLFASLPHTVGPIGQDSLTVLLRLLSRATAHEEHP